MSGRKLFDFNMQQWFQGPAAASGLTSLLPLALGAAQMVQQEMIRRDVQALREQLQRSDEALSALSEHTRAYEESTNQALAEQIERLRDLQTTTAADIAAVADQARSAVLMERQERRSALSRLDHSVDGVLADRDRAHEAAQRWLADALALRSAIAATLPHEEYRPRELADITSQLTTADSNLRSGLVEAALALGQSAYHRLSDLRVDLELQQREWVAARWEAMRDATVLDTLIAHSHRLPAEAFGDQDAASELEDEAVFVDVDRLSAGRLRTLEHEVKAILAALDDDAPHLSVDKLRELADRRIPGLRKQVEEVVDAAWQQARAAHFRAEIAELVAEVLEEGFAYRTIGGDYEYGDDQRDFVARLRQPVSDNEIVIHVRAGGDGVRSGQVEIESISLAPESERVRRERVEAATAHLERNRISTGAVVEVVEPVVQSPQHDVVKTGSGSTHPEEGGLPVRALEPPSAESAGSG